MRHSKSSSKNYSYLICIVTGLFIFYKYVLQISPSVMSHDLMRDFQLTGAGLGNLTACFLYSYLLMQIPAGIIFDRYKPRVVIATAICLAAVFTEIFALTDSTFIACLSRAGMGLVTAFAFIAYLKMISIWAPPKHFALMAGFAMTIAMIGAINGQAPLAVLVEQVGWRHALMCIALLGFVLALLSWFIIQDKNNSTDPAQNSTNKSFISQVLIIIKNKQNWILGLFCGCAFAPVSAFGGLWGVPFLQEAYHLTRTEAAQNISLIFIGFALGCPLLGWISDRLNSRITVMSIGMLIAFLCLSSVIYLYQFLTPLKVSLLLFAFGFSVSALMMCFVVAIEIQTTLQTASLMAFINTIPSIFEAVTEPFIGKMLDLGWEGQLLSDARIFSVGDYQLGLLILPIYLIVALILLMFIRYEFVPRRGA